MAHQFTMSHIAYTDGPMRRIGNVFNQSGNKFTPENQRPAGCSNTAHHFICIYIYISVFILARGEPSNPLLITQLPTLLIMSSHSSSTDISWSSLRKSKKCSAARWDHEQVLCRLDEIEFNDTCLHKKVEYLRGHNFRWQAIVDLRSRN